MAHGISFNLLSGKAEAAFARSTWHDLGYVFQPGDSLNSDAFKAQSGAAFDVSSENIYLGGSDTPIADHFALVRKDTKQTLSIVGKEYQIFQYNEGFAFLDNLWQDGSLQYESVFVLKGGRMCVLQARLPSLDYVTPDDKNERYITFVMSHGFGAIKAFAVSKRTVCQNTLDMALAMNRIDRANKVAGSACLSIAHSGDLRAKLNKAHLYLSQLDAKFTRYTESAQSLLKGITQAQIDDFIEALFPEPTNVKKRGSTVHNDKMDAIAHAIEQTVIQMPSIKGTWWGLVNGITAYVDHGPAARQSKDLAQRAENRYINSNMGPGADKKAQAFDLALSMSA